MAPSASEEMVNDIVLATMQPRIHTARPGKFKYILSIWPNNIVKMMEMKNPSQTAPSGTESMLRKHCHSELYQTYHQFTNSQAEPLLRQIARGQMACVRKLSLRIAQNQMQNKRLRKVTYREKWLLVADEKRPSETTPTRQLPSPIETVCEPFD